MNLITRKERIGAFAEIIQNLPEAYFVNMYEWMLNGYKFFVGSRARNQAWLDGVP